MWNIVSTILVKTPLTSSFWIYRNTFINSNGKMEKFEVSKQPKSSAELLMVP